MKVTQRLPVRLAIERAEGDPPLRLGMSAHVVIDTGRTPATASTSQSLAGIPNAAP